MAGRSETVELIIKTRQTGEKVVKSVRQQFVELKNTIFNVRTALLAVAAAYAGIRIGKDLIERSDQQKVAVAKLHTALVSMGRYTPELEAGLLNTAAALQEITNYGDEATIAGQAFLTTYKDITDDLLPRSSKTMLDLAALMGGDTTQAANMLGKASMGMTGELRRAGITVDENTFKLRGYAGVLDEIEAQVRGQAEAQRQATGSLTAMSNKWGDVKEKLGDIIKATAEPVFRLWLSNLNDFDQRLDQFLRSDKVKVWVDDVSTTIVSGMAAGMASVSEFKTVWLSLKSAILQIELAFGTGIERILALLATLSKAMSDVYNSPFNAARAILPPGTGEALKQGADDIESYRQTVDGLNKDIAKTIVETDKLGVSAAERALKVQEAVGRAVEAALKARATLKGAQGGTDTPTPAPVATGGGGGGAAAAKQIEQMLNARIQSVLVRAKAVMETELAVLTDMYDKGLIAVQEYYDKKSELLEKDYQAEVKAINDKLAIEKDAAQALGLQDDLFVKQQEHQRELLSLAKERAEAERTVAEAVKGRGEILAEMRLAVLPDGDPDRQFEEEMNQFNQYWESRIQQLQEYKASEDQISEAFALKEQARQQKLFELQMDVLRNKMQAGLDIAGGFSNAFAQIYEASGKQMKEFFYLSKAAAIAEINLKAGIGIMEVWSKWSSQPWIAAAYTAMLVVQQYAALATVAAQSFATGGMVQGWSPSKTADNIPARLTAGEFVMPVDAVRKYGVGFFEALRRQAIPDDIMVGLRFPSLPVHRPAHAAFASGGMVSGGGSGDAGRQEKKQEFTIINVLDGRELDGYLASKRGQDAILNVLSSRAGTVRKIMK